ncbi:uncharacterized protein M6B38_305175 [Iris pallida]|uniref:N-acetyltransferase domain-containing protein n=1 Tax=Iris pallida TaxID=29817 RepID=A0AAX6GSV7_IRIPA|nr:uncharacterized protein M6B38_347685 [Iris pallida]KAJ6841757.1 uncharacterized protein M6B38_305175 [Iris pallida]
MVITTTTTLPPISASTDPKALKSCRKPPPITISLNPSHLDPLHLQRLLSSAAYSPHRFPLLPSSSSDVDLVKLSLAIAHSSVIVSAFCRRRFLHPDAACGGYGFGFEDLFERMGRAPDPDHLLVGFGRAVSDGGLTASIHDVVVMPSLQRLGIGRKIVQRILRVLTSKGIYDISALCSRKERLFFQACGFGDDSLGSTTMMYTRTALSFSQEDQMVRPAGRLLLLVPPAREPYHLKKTAAQAEDPSNA